MQVTTLHFESFPITFESNFISSWPYIRMNFLAEKNKKIINISIGLLSGVIGYNEKGSFLAVFTIS